MKFHKHDAGHMTYMAAISILKIQWTDFDETWYEASATQAHYIFIK